MIPMKQILITSCLNCPYRQTEWISGDNYCFYKSFIAKRLILFCDADPIDSLCELEDACISAQSGVQ